jgi:hypothetical protein
MRLSLVMQAHVLDEKEGTLEIDYYLSDFTKNEKFSVYINGEERCKRTGLTS